MPSPALNPLGVVGHLPNLPNPNRLPLPPFSIGPEQRLPGQPNLPQQQQQRPFFDASQPPPFTQLPAKPMATNTPTEASQSTPATIIKHLHELAQQSKLVTEQQQKQQQLQQQQQQQQQKVEQKEESGNRTPETATESGISSVTPVKGNRGGESSMVSSDFEANPKSLSSLPPDWKAATDPEGKVYYYHIVTRWAATRARSASHWLCFVMLYTAECFVSNLRIASHSILCGWYSFLCGWYSFYGCRKTQWEIPKWENEDLSSQKEVFVIPFCVIRFCSSHTLTLACLNCISDEIHLQSFKIIL